MSDEENSMGDYKSAAECAKAIRTAYKAEGWTRCDISVRARNFAGGSSVDVTIKSAKVDETVAARILKTVDYVRRCKATGEILSGCNRYTHIYFSEEAKAEMGAAHLDALLKASLQLDKAEHTSSLELIVPGVLLGFAHNQRGPWKQLWTTNTDGRIVHLETEEGLVDGAFEVERTLRRSAASRASEAA